MAERAGRHPGGALAPMPIVVGFGRSGTTLLRLMLDAHPDLAIPPETGFLVEAVAVEGGGAGARARLFDAITGFETWERMQVSADALRERLEEIEPFDVAAGVRAFYRLYAERFSKPRWGDKTPYYTGHLDRIEALLPEARFVHVIRDGRDVALSMRGLWFSPGDDPARLARGWVSQVKTARRLGARCRHYLEVRYERLVTDPDAELRRICDFVELPFDERMARYHEQAAERLAEMTPAGLVDRPRGELPDVIRLATRPPDPSRIGRWRREMPRKDRVAFERVAAPLLEELGYGTALPLRIRVRRGLRRRRRG